MSETKTLKLKDVKIQLPADFTDEFTNEKFMEWLSYEFKVNDSMSAATRYTH